MKKLKPYNPKANCSKCGHSEITTEYHKLGQHSMRECWLSIDKEHLDRQCKRCGFIWFEKCAKLKKGPIEGFGIGKKIVDAPYPKDKLAAELAAHGWIPDVNPKITEYAPTGSFDEEEPVYPQHLPPDGDMS